ncbi:hypothetical protein AX15_003274 [Amanita polypyramis BW_CC]|nr:hypothetical protein AX15_003274 [Amanita polypyramis BW_CC]
MHSARLLLKLPRPLSSRLYIGSRISIRVCGNGRHKFMPTLQSLLPGPPSFTIPSGNERITGRRQSIKMRNRSTRKQKRTMLCRRNMKASLERAIKELDMDMEDSLAWVGFLTESYSKLSLSGSFAGQVQKSVRMLETNLEAMQTSKTEPRAIDTLKGSLANMQAKLKVVGDANVKVKERIGRPGCVSRMRSALIGR